MYRRAENEQIRLEDIFPYDVHIISYDAGCNRYDAGCNRVFGLTVPASQAIFAELDVVIDQMQFFDITVRGLGFYSLDGLSDQNISCLTFSRTTHDRQKIHIDKWIPLCGFDGLDRFDRLDGLDRFERFVGFDR